MRAELSKEVASRLYTELRQMQLVAQELQRWAVEQSWMLCGSCDALQPRALELAVRMGASWQARSGTTPRPRIQRARETMNTV